MDTNKLLLRLPTMLQEPVLMIGLRTGWAWYIPQLAVLKRWFRLSGTDEGVLEWIVKHAQNWQMWRHFWLDEAERADADAQRALEGGHCVTARGRFHQAVLAYALALWQTSSLEERKHLYPQVLKSFAAYGALTTPPIVKLDIAFDPVPLPAYLRLPHAPAGGERLPVVVLVQGLDTIKEMDDFAERPLLERGLATLTLDEPGVGEARLRGLRLDSLAILDAAAHAVCEAIEERPDLDAHRIGMFGWSFGGFVAPYFAAVELRYRRNRERASRFYDAAGRPRDDGTRLILPLVKTLEVLPLIDWYAARADLETESGVSYLIRAGDTTILFDLGLNRKGEQEPPLSRNMARLGVDPAGIDFVVLSHPHGDHLGGFKNQFARQAIVQQEHDPLAGKPVYATVSLRLGCGRSTIVQAPRLLAPGVATTGPLPRALFLMGYVQEQALAINVEGKGLLLIVGCGHPGVEAIVERAEQVFALPVYGVIGGLHFPVTDDRARIGPFRMQQLLGSPNPPWRPVGKQAVSRTVEYLKARGIQYLAPSAHDTCDWSLHAFAEAFGNEYHPVKVGEWLRIQEKRSAL